MGTLWRLLQLGAVCLAACLAVSCSNESTPPSSEDAGSANPVRPIRIGSAPPGGAFHRVGDAIAQTLLTHRPDPTWQPLALATKGSLDNIEKLADGQLDFALANAAISHFAALEGYPVQSVMTLAPNVAMFVTPRDSPIRRITDLPGRRVVAGPDGAGFSFFLVPILVAHNVNYNDLNTIHASQKEAVDLLATGQADAAFLGGAVPTDSIARASEIMPIRFIPYEELPTKVLKQEFIFYNDARIPAHTYQGQESDFDGLDVGSMQLVTSAEVEEELVYAFTRAIYENREEIARRHPAGKAIHALNAPRDVGTPFHPGAIRFYREVGIWPAEPGVVMPK